MKRLLFSAAALTFLAPLAAEAVTITLDAETLRDQYGVVLPTSGLLILTAATQGTFLGPTPTSFASGTELEVKRWDLSAWATPGAISDTTGSLPFTGDWDAGDPLRLYWYPTLTLTSSEPGLGTAYGTYTDPVGIDGSDPWITPPESLSISLRFATSDASQLLLPGSNLPSAGVANLTVVPEPGTATFGLVALGALLRRRRR